MTRKPPTVGIAGLGYMGLATALGFARRGIPVVGYELRAEVRRDLARGRTSIHEPGIVPLLRGGLASGRFRVVDSWADLVRTADILFLCLPTPRRSDGRIDLRPMLRGVRELGHALREVTEPRLVVVKSTVVPGTTEERIRPLLERTSHRRAPSVTVAANPEFLAEGSMVKDVLEPERIVLGVSHPADARKLRRVYRAFPAPVIVLPPTGAELVKYASNAFLALKVGFVNEVARLAEAVGADVDPVAAAVGLDSRIGQKFLSAGPGFGGSCFEKDVRALIARSHDLGLKPRMLEALVPSNDDQTRHAFDLVRRAMGIVQGRRIAVLGLAFKAGTDDVRESRALPLVRLARSAGASVRVHDPVALENFRRAWSQSGGPGGQGVRFCTTVAEAVEGADAAVIPAGWPEYTPFPTAWSTRMRHPLVVDLRRALPRSMRMRPDLRWVGLGVGSVRDGAPGSASLPRRKPRRRRGSR
ncbi:MAG: UDP-glucose/GDP-mannose dehydrogenase family protein [Thermoplasmata archaeon]|nr:UDP-glucose/GDP-mannose dehydrogenase family protein [Thermoplasmata archaeon]